MEKFSEIAQAQDTLFESHYKEMGSAFKSLLESNQSPDVQAILESFDTTPYALDEKIVKSKSDISYVFKDEAGDRYRIQFLVSPKFGKGVAKVYIGKGKGARLFVDKIDRFTNPKAMIATVINFFSEHLLTPEGMTLRGFIVDLSGAAAIRSIPVLKKVIKSALVSKIKVADDTFQPQDGRKYLWITKSTLKPADVFNGPGSVGAPWLQGKEKAEDRSTDKKGDTAGVKGAKFDPMLVAQTLINSILPLMKKYKGLELKPSLNNQLKYVSVAAVVEGQPITHYPFGFEALKGGSYEPKKLATELSGFIDSRMKQIADAQKKAKEESERTMNLKKDPAFYLKQQQAAIEGEINLKAKGFNFKLEFSSSGKIVKARVLENGTTPIDYVEFTAPDAKEDNEEMRDFAISQIMKILKKNGYMKGRKAGLLPNQPVKVTNFSRYGRGFKTEGDVDYGVLTSAEETFGEVVINRNGTKHKVDWVDIEPQSGAADGGQTKTQTQTATGKVKVQKDENMNLLIDAGLKGVKKIDDRLYSAMTKAQAEYTFNVDGGKLYGVHGPEGGYDSDPSSNGTWKGENVLKRLAEGAFWVGKANKNFDNLANALNKELSATATVPTGYKLVKVVSKVYQDSFYLLRHLQTPDGTELREDYEFGRPFGGHFYLQVDVGMKKAETLFFRNYTYTASEFVQEMIKISKGLLPAKKAASQTSTETGQKAKGVSVFWKDGIEKYARIIAIEGGRIKLSKWNSDYGETEEWLSDISYGYYFDDGKYDGQKVTMSKLVELLNA